MTLFCCHGLVSNVRKRIFDTNQIKFFLKMQTDEEEKITVDFKKFKGHHRKFPWPLVIRIVVAAVCIGIIFYLVEYLDAVRKSKIEEKPAFEIEYEF